MQNDAHTFSSPFLHGLGELLYIIHSQMQYTKKYKVLNRSKKKKKKKKSDSTNPSMNK
jgi:hypothetical protein